MSSPDVLEHHKKVGYGDFPAYANSRFILNSRCNHDCKLMIYKGNELQLKYDLDTSQLIQKSDKIEFNIEFNTNSS